MVSAYDEANQLYWPAKYKTVLGVCAWEVPRHEWKFVTKKLFRACGYPRELPNNLQLYNLHGHSFAATHFQPQWPVFYRSIKTGKAGMYLCILKIYIETGFYITWMHLQDNEGIGIKRYLLSLSWQYVLANIDIIYNIIYNKNIYNFLNFKIIGGECI
ncbi:hypothetical protein [Parageobacillus thermoglucosidasius]|uniref:hypothetical protein n=1 Tax=Parageobacillus thermoglucosidasius TaxID=1426 RepID=UPI0021190402|nr:hypothetical protein [Parageobacillus thermoglucosidasius]